jgi:hypothetical protein
MISPKRLFVGLCMAVWLVNILMAGHGVTVDFWSGLIASIFSVPFWALIGALVSGMSVFLFRLMRVDVSSSLSLWQKVDIGLALALIFKPTLGIPF